jgi:flagellar assembly protein FliH
MIEVVKTHSPVRYVSIIKSPSVRLKKKLVEEPIAVQREEPVFFPEPVLSTVEEINVGVTHFSDKLQEEFQRGYDAARLEFEQELGFQINVKTQETVQRFDSILTKLSHEHKVLLERIEQIVPQLSIAIAEKIIRKQLTEPNDVIVAQVRDAIRRVVGVNKVRIRINQEDEAILREHRSSLMQEVDSINDIIIEIDDKIEAGGCILESDMGNVDARLSTQLKQIEDAFFE